MWPMCQNHRFQKMTCFQMHPMEKRLNNRKVFIRESEMGKCADGRDFVFRRNQNETSSSAWAYVYVYLMWFGNGISPERGCPKPASPTSHVAWGARSARGDRGETVRQDGPTDSAVFAHFITYTSTRLHNNNNKGTVRKFSVMKIKISGPQAYLSISTGSIRSSGCL